MKGLWFALLVVGGLTVGTIMQGAAIAKPAKGTAKPTPKPEPGIEILRNRIPFRWEGDFDNDGIKDTLTVVQLTSAFRPSSRVQLFNFWGKTPLKTPENLALELISSRKKRPILIYSQSYFDSPLWQGQQLPIQVVKRGTPAHQTWRTKVATLRSDGIVLGTEAGIDTLLYWSGETYRLYTPPDLP